MLKSKKVEVIDNLTTSFANTTAVVICDYKGLTVSELEELRKAARAKDPRVLQVESDEIVEGVRKNGVPIEYVLFEDEGHGFVKKENQIEAYSSILKFLDTYLKKENEPIDGEIPSKEIEPETN